MMYASPLLKVILRYIPAIPFVKGLGDIGLPASTPLQNACLA